MTAVAVVSSYSIKVNPEFSAKSANKLTICKELTDMAREYWAQGNWGKKQLSISEVSKFGIVKLWNSFFEVF